MTFKKTTIGGVYIIDPEIYDDIRGSFSRMYCKKEFTKQKISFVPLQTNISFTKRKGTIRGIHFQKIPFEEAKLVGCVSGRIFDVVVDLRKNSPTYKSWLGVDIDDENHRAIFIPKGCAHGFQTLTDNCILVYHMSEYYSKKHNSGVIWNDPDLQIPWPISAPILSDKDMKLSKIKSLP